MTMTAKRLVSLTLLALLGAMLLNSPTSKAQEVAPDDPRYQLAISLSGLPRTTPRDLATLADELIDGQNVMLGSVDGEAITTASIRAELTDLEARVETQLKYYRSSLGFEPPRKQIESLLILQNAHVKALHILLLKEAKSAGLNVGEVDIDSRISDMKKAQKIDEDDAEAWATYTLQQLGKTPLELREEIREMFLRQQALWLMAGKFGPIRGLPLSVFFPLEVRPRDLRRHFHKTRDKWLKATDIQYTWVGIEAPVSLPIPEKKKIDRIITEARRRIVQGEKMKDVVEKWMKPEFKREKLDQQAACKVIAETTVKVATDDKLDIVGAETRAMSVGAAPAYVRPQRGSDDTAINVYAVVRLDKRTEKDKRIFTDPVVQKGLTNELENRLLSENELKVQNTLIDRAIIFPKNLVRVRE